ncbi:hypothetical protein ABZV91_12990 [Nocardia sp. NPDC004568]
MEVIGLVLSRGIAATNLAVAYAARRTAQRRTGLG